MDNRTETLLKGQDLIKDLKSRRKGEKITKVALEKINKDRDQGAKQITGKYRRAVLFVIKYRLAQL